MPPRMWLLCGIIDWGSFSVPRFPYRLCLRSSPPPPSLSAWKPCSAISGSCSILPGSGSWPLAGGCAGPKAEWGLFSDWAGEVAAEQLHATAPGPLCTGNLCAPGAVPPQCECM